MKILFDTSVLVAALVAVHPFHGRAVAELQRALRGEIQYLVATHSLAELYAVLTRLPLRPRFSSTVAWHLISENVIGGARLVALTARDYRDSVKVP